MAKEILLIDAQLGNARQMPSLLCQKILILAEDKRSWKHGGVDFLAILRSITLTLIGKPHGGSTILQQLVRTLTKKYDRTLQRKVYEIALSYLVAKKVSRSIYPRVYLSVAYYGTGLEGYDKVFQHVKCKTVNELNIAAMIVARLKYPEPRAINISKQKNIQRREIFLLRKYQKYSSDRRMFSHVQAV